MSNFTTVKQFEDTAVQRLSKHAKGYYNSAANAEITLKQSSAQFDQLKLKTKCEVDIDKFEGL